MKIVLAGAFALFGVAAYARHVNLNGTWVMQPAQSEYAGLPVTQSGTITIDDREGNVTISRDFTYAAATQTFRYHDAADGPRGATIRGSGEQVKARWEGDLLKVTTIRDGVATVDNYSLAEDGVTLRDIVEQQGREPVTYLFRREQ
jgi:hypothetical protein